MLNFFHFLFSDKKDFLKFYSIVANLHMYYLFSTISVVNTYLQIGPYSFLKFVHSMSNAHLLREISYLNLF